MEFTGRLAAFPPSHLLQWAAHERATGTLVVRRTRREKRVALRRGSVVYCRSNQPQEMFGQHLIAHGLVEEEVLVGSERALLPADAVESLVPAYVRPPGTRELDGLSVVQRVFLESIDGRATLRRLLAGESETRSDQMELLLLELRRRNVVLLPASLDEVERRLEEGSALRRLVRRLRP